MYGQKTPHKLTKEILVNPLEFTSNFRLIISGVMPTWDRENDSILKNFFALLISIHWNSQNTVKKYIFWGILGKIFMNKYLKMKEMKIKKICISILRDEGPERRVW